MRLLNRTKSLLKSYRLSPRKAASQYFMIESSILERMIKYASVSRSDTVLDIGAGLGFLTRSLAERAGSVVAVESDLSLVGILREELRKFSNVKLVAGDVLRVSMPEFNKVISIPPYKISSSLLLWLFKRNFECAVLVFQKEFANRLIASIGSEDYGWLTVITYYHTDVELLDEVPHWMFYPEPNVVSTIVRLRPRKSPPFVLKNREFFEQLIPMLFTNRNRKVKNAIMPLVKSKHLMTDGEPSDSLLPFPFLERRVRELAPEDFGALINAIA